MELLYHKDTFRIGLVQIDICKIMGVLQCSGWEIKGISASNSCRKFYLKLHLKNRMFFYL